jgi:hypothetical protein
MLLPHNNQVLIIGGTSGGAAVAKADVDVSWVAVGQRRLDTCDQS